MNKKRVLVAILSLMLSFCAIFSLMACDEHTHDYGTVLKHNAEQHFKQCYCGDKIEVTNHVFDAGTYQESSKGGKIKYVCEDCGYEKVEDLALGDKTVIELFNSLSNIDFSDGVNIAIDGNAFANDLEIPYYTEENYGGETITTVDFTADADGEIYFGLDKKDKVVVNGALLFKAVGLDENGEEFVTVDASMYAVVKDDVMYLSLDLIGVMCGLDEALQELDGNKFVQNEKFSITMEEFVDQIPEEATSVMATLVEIIEQNSDFIDDELVPLFNRIWGDVDDAIEKVVEANLNSTYTVNKVKDKYEVVLDFDKIIATGDKLYNMTMAEYIDEVLGAGTFEDIKEKTVGIFDLTLNEIVYYIFTTDGLTIAELENKINEIGKQFNPEFNLADMLQLGGMSFAEFIETDEAKAMLNMTVGEIIVSLTGSARPMAETGVNEEVEALKTMLANALDQAGQMTFYEAVASLTDAGDLDLEQVKEMVGQIFGIAKEMLGFKIVFNSQAKFEKVVFEYKLSEETIEKLSALFPTEETGVEIVGGGDVTVTVSVGKFANALNVDYNAVIESFKAAA